MFISKHSASNKIVSGTDIINPKLRFTDTDEYRCVLCNKKVEINQNRNEYVVFEHECGKKDCFHRPKNSKIHQMGCELAIKTACNLKYHRGSIEIEKEVKTDSGKMTRADVMFQQPDPTVIEIYYRSRLCSLYRKLETILEAGYSCYVVCTVSDEFKPAHKPTNFDNSLGKFGPIKTGRFNPKLGVINLGTKITDEIVDFEPVNRYSDYILSG